MEGLEYFNTSLNPELANPVLVPYINTTANIMIMIAMLKMIIVISPNPHSATKAPTVYSRP